ncbi:MAG: hypothetical protein CL678_14960 [Bdellovibrionaceae bacterium]|nr:hypothetical protein [Pseudobdellovibrionaceae bacterium]
MDIVTFIPPHLRKKAMIACQNEDLPVLMSGEDGTGKSAIARWIHRHRSRSIQPLHLYDPKKDLISQILNAHQASLVFSEITKLSQSDQKKISKFLQSGSIKDPQSNLPKIVSVHLYFLTQHKINDQSCDPFFYPSLFKQIKSQMIEIPSLIHRKQEFKDICMGLLSEMTHELKKDFIKGFEKKSARSAP